VACPVCVCAVRIAPNATGAPIGGDCTQEEMDAIVLPVGTAPLRCPPCASTPAETQRTSTLETAPLSQTTDVGEVTRCDGDQSASRVINTC
jgi:hypothetical protein